MSTNLAFNPDFANDLESRCPIMLLLDVSQSMEGEPIRELQNGLMAFANYLREDALSKRRMEVGVIAFGDEELEVLRYDSEGNLDPDFGTQGIVRRTDFGYIYTPDIAAALDMKGRILVAATESSTSVILARYNP